MKYIALIIMLITPSFSQEENAVKKKPLIPVSQKKQFVNFINDDGEYARNYVDLTNNEANGFDDIFRGRGNGAGLIDGTMQLTENQMGGLAMDGDDMENTYTQLSQGSNQIPSFVENPMGDQRIVHVFPAAAPRHRIRRRRRRRHRGLRRLFICRGNSDLPWLKLKMKCASSNLQGDLRGQPLPENQQDYTNDGLGYNPPSFFGTFDVNTGSEDLLSPFYGSEGKLEDNINLSDNINSPGRIDMQQFNDALQSMNEKDVALVKGTGKNKQMNTGDSLGGDVSDMMSSDEKLQKLLETSIGSNGGEANDDAPSSATVGSFLSALLNQGSMNNALHAQHLQPQQTAGQDENQANGYDMNPSDQLQQNALNQLSGTMGQNGMGAIQPVTVHVHASDKPGHKDAPPSPETSKAVAQQAQEIAMKQHKAKLSKLKKRLALLREKLTELEDEQAKKSTSNKGNDPKQERNNAIKKLLIKNLKLAALIATKEIQLEEEKSKGLEYISGKKEDGTAFDSINGQLGQISKFTKSKPLTELSKKAEEEVNHLSNADKDQDKNHDRLRSNASSSNNVASPAPQNETARDVTTSPEPTLPEPTSQDSPSSDNVVGKSTLNRINETLQALDNDKSQTTSTSTSTSSATSQRSILAANSEVFLNKLRKQISSMSPDQAQAVEDKALATLFEAIKAKQNFMSAKRNRIQSTKKLFSKILAH